MQGGSVELDGKDMLALSRAQIARMTATYRRPIIPFPFKVLDVILMGRTAHLGLFSSQVRRPEIAEEILDTLISGICVIRFTRKSVGEKSSWF